MKINWGTAIVIAFVLFAAFITYFMVRGAQNRVDLVSPDYYDQETKYQERINNQARAKQLGNIIFQASESGDLVIVFPASFSGNAATGIIHFYKPDNADFDQKIPLAIDAENKQLIKSADMIKGLWYVKIDAQLNGIGYYWEESINF